MLLTTGTIFQAEDKLGNKYLYEFKGIETDSSTGCDYIHLYNLTLKQNTNVEHAWFRKRKLVEILK